MLSTERHCRVIDLDIGVDLSFWIFAANNHLSTAQYKCLSGRDDHQPRFWQFRHMHRPLYALLYLFECSNKLTRSLVASLGGLGQSPLHERIHFGRQVRSQAANRWYVFGSMLKDDVYSGAAGIRRRTSKCLEQNDCQRVEVGTDIG